MTPSAKSNGTYLPVKRWIWVTRTLCLGCAWEHVGEKGGVDEEQAARNLALGHANETGHDFVLKQILLGFEL